MTRQVEVDIILFGAGIAGLWMGATLRQHGYSVALLESQAVGGIQTLASQGIIHGGTKYALLGSLNESARAISEMPAAWRACLAGKGSLDLSDVKILSPNQYLWSTEQLLSRVAGFFADKAMRSRVQTVAGDTLPPPFDHPKFKGKLYQLDEPVLDVTSLVDSLQRYTADKTVLAEQGRVNLHPQQPTLVTYESDDGPVNIQGQRLLLAAGEGNAGLLQQLGRQQPAMQRRPLHMVAMRGKLPSLYAHCLGPNANPRLTITSYPLSDGEQIWYLGGQLAENGVQLDESKQIAAAKRELKATLPWVDIHHNAWHSFIVQRAEQQMSGGRRPDSCYLHSRDQVITAWPTKLAFAPRLGHELIALLKQEGVVPRQAHTDALKALPTPVKASPPWESITR